MADVDATQAERVRDAIAASGGTAIAIACDVSDPDSVERAITTTVDRLGKLDIVCANAGINGVFAPVEELKPDEWDRTLAINLTGTYLTVHFAVPHLKRTGSGSIIITSSVNGTRSFGNPGASAYSTSKAGQVAFMKMMALEFGRHTSAATRSAPARSRPTSSSAPNSATSTRLALSSNCPRAVRRSTMGKGIFLKWRIRVCSWRRTSAATSPGWRSSSMEAPHSCASRRDGREPPRVGRRHRRPACATPVAAVATCNRAGEARRESRFCCSSILGFSAGSAVRERPGPKDGT